MSSRIIPPKDTKRPEARVQAQIIKKLQHEGWFVRETHGTWYQSGFPDLYAVHARKGHRWIEVKDPNRKGRSSLFTPAQHEVFGAWAARGVGVWVLVGGSEEEYQKLFNPPNWHLFL